MLSVKVPIEIISISWHGTMVFLMCPSTSPPGINFRIFYRQIHYQFPDGRAHQARIHSSTREELNVCHMVSILLFSKSASLQVVFSMCIPFTHKSDQFQISPAASSGISHHTIGPSYKRTQMKCDYMKCDHIRNSYYLTYTFLLKDWENVLF